MNNCRPYFKKLTNQPDFIFCENAGGTQIPIHVINRLNNFLENYYCQPYGLSNMSEKATEILVESRSFVDTLFNNIKGKIVFGSSASQLAYNFSKQFENLLNDHDEIILCNCSHESTITPFERLNKNKLIDIKWWNINHSTFNLDINTLLDNINDKTRLIVFPHVSNILGIINDVKLIIKQVKDKYPNIIIYVDGVAYGAHDIIDVEDFNCDCYVVSFYKIFGLRISALYIKNNIFTNLPNINHSFLTDNNQIKSEIGGPQYELTCSLLGIKDYICQLINCHFFNRELLIKFYQQVRHHEIELINHFDQLISKLKNFKYISNKHQNRIPLFSFTNNRYGVTYLTNLLNELNIGCKHGSFYSNKLLQSLNIDNCQVIRFSFSHYNTISEIQQIENILTIFNHHSYYDNNISYLQLQFTASPQLKKSFNYLNIDNYYENQRFRNFSLIEIDDDDNILSLKIKGNYKFFQSSYYNSYLGEKYRNYQNIDINLLNDSSFKNLIKLFIQQIPYKVKFLTVHQIRVITNYNSTNLVPEGIHRDGYNYIGIFVTNLSNINGGESKIYDTNKNLIFEKKLAENQMIFINDQKLFHSVNNISSNDNIKIGYRDIFVLTTIN